MIKAELHIARCPKMLPRQGVQCSLTVGSRTIYGQLLIAPHDDAKLRPGRKTEALGQLVERLDWCEQHRGEILYLQDLRGSSHIEVALI